MSGLKSGIWNPGCRGLTPWAATFELCDLGQFDLTSLSHRFFICKVDLMIPLQLFEGGRRKDPCDVLSFYVFGT